MGLLSGRTGRTLGFGMMAGEEDIRALTAKRIAAVRARFLSGLGERVGALSALALAASGPDPESASASADGLRLGLHNLVGAAPTLGLAELGRRAASLERRVIEARLADGRLPAPIAEAIAADIASLAGADSD